MEVLVYSAFLIVLYTPDVFVTQSTLVMGQQSIPKGGCREALWSNIVVTKLECTGHVQKRTGARLKGLVKEKAGKILHDSKTLEGKGRLNQSEIDRLQNCCGLAIRRSVNSV
jgi:hypothetical protein